MKHLKFKAIALSFGLVGLGATGCSDPAVVATDAQATDTPRADVPTADASDTGAPQDAPATDVPAMVTCGTILGGACDPVSGRGCPTGQACYVRTPMGGMPMGACDMPGRGEWDARCANNNDCREGFACLPTSIGGTTRACTRLCCEGDNAACRDESRGGMPGAVCDRGLILNGSMVHICQASLRCDAQALSANGCPADRPYCNVVSMDGTTACSPLGTNPGTDGASCCTDGCQPGFTCIGAPGMCDATHTLRVCRRVCNPSAAGADAGVVCPAMQRCAGLMGRPDSFGACAPMM